MQTECIHGYLLDFSHSKLIILEQNTNIAEEKPQINARYINFILYFSNYAL